VVGGPVVPGSPLTLIPFGGLLGQDPFGAGEILEFFVAVLPACLALILMVLAVPRFTPALLALALNVFALIVFLETPGYDHAFGLLRIALGVPMAFVLGLVAVSSERVRSRLIVLPVLFWSVSWLGALPVMLEV
jgi:hypothetical protein